MKLILLFAVIVIFASLFAFSIKNKTQLSNQIPSSALIQKPSLPVADINNRITKKPFGIYVTPGNSPVSPEVFTGYHTGIDIEYEDVEGDVNIHTILDGKVLFSGQAQGYGGVIAIQHNIDNRPVIAIYGHLKPKSMIPINSEVKKDQVIGILGKGYTSETDHERKHLHFALYPGTKLNLLGYVQKESELLNWINPLSLYP